MTKIEYKKCEKLMNDAIHLVRQSQEEFKQSEKYLKQQKSIKWEIEQRKADQHHGEAIGMNQVLAVLGFKHEKMAELEKLL